MTRPALIDPDGRAAQPHAPRRAWHWGELSMLLTFVLVPLAIGFAGSLATASSVNDWYPTLVKPDFNPPNWLFGPVWTLLYVMMGLACHLVWRSAAPVTERRPALVAYGVQLALNLAWSFVFFGLQSPLLALIVIAAMWSAIAVTMRRFLAIDRLAGWLFAPYLAWVSFAALLNGAIVTLN